MQSSLWVILLILVAILSFVIGYSLAPTDVGVVRHTTKTSFEGHQKGKYGPEGSGGYGSPADSGGYGAESGGYGAPAGGGYGAPAGGGAAVPLDSQGQLRLGHQEAAERRPEGPGPCL